jgi:hypothetical protein
VPDIVRLRYVGNHEVAVPALGRSVEPDCIIDFAGKVLDDGADDAVLIEFGNPPIQRAFPRSLWKDETPEMGG